MKIAIFGSNSEIAKDLIHSIEEKNKNVELFLFTRHPEKIISWQKEIKLQKKYPVYNYSNFESFNYDAIINFVGAGDPAKIEVMDKSIFDITFFYDQIILNYLKLHPASKYIFMSSGAVFGNNFQYPVSEKTISNINVNDIDSNSWYGLSKLFAECRHRLLQSFSIIDVRIFNYFSYTQNINSRFLLTDIIRSIKNDQVLNVSNQNVMRDFIGKDDFYNLITLLLDLRSENTSIDCYSKAPVNTNQILIFMRENYGLKFIKHKNLPNFNQSSAKLNYYSLSRKAEKFGFEPKFTSMELIQNEIKKIFNFLRN